MIGAVLTAAGALLGGMSLRAWAIVGAVIALAAWSGYVYSAGHAAADGAWRAKALEAKIARLELEITVRKEAGAAEDRLRAGLERENGRQKKLIGDYVAELRTRPGKCLLGPDAARLQ